MPQRSGPTRANRKHESLLSGSKFNGGLLSLKPSQLSPGCGPGLPQGTAPAVGVQGWLAQPESPAPGRLLPCWATQELGDPEFHLPLFFFKENNFSNGVLQTSPFSHRILPKTTSEYRPT